MMPTMARAREPVLDPKRIAAITGVLLLHLMVLGAMLLPRQAAEPWFPRPPDDPWSIDWEDPPLPVRPPEPVALPPPTPPTLKEPPPAAAPTPAAPPMTPMVDNEMVFKTLNEPVVANALVAPQASGPLPGTRSNLLSLRTVRAPPPAYPRRELARGIEGMVELRVLVDVAGMPTMIDVIGGSGNRNFELAAIRALKRWRFQPHSVDGEPRAAWARVPFEFRTE